MKIIIITSVISSLSLINPALADHISNMNLEVQWTGNGNKQLGAIYTGIVVPIFENNDSVLFSDLRLSRSIENAAGIHLGIGGRKKISGVVIGLNSFYDYYVAEKNYGQYVGGVEALYDIFKVRGTFYCPTNSNFKGIELEAGLQIKKIFLSVKPYYFFNQESIKGVGLQAKHEKQLSGWQLNGKLGYQFDNYFQHQVTLQLGMQIPLTNKNGWDEGMRMIPPIERNMFVYFHDRTKEDKPSERKSDEQIENKTEEQSEKRHEKPAGKKPAELPPLTEKKIQIWRDKLEGKDLSFFPIETQREINGSVDKIFRTLEKLQGHRLSTHKVQIIDQQIDGILTTIHNKNWHSTKSSADTLEQQLKILLSLSIEESNIKSELEQEKERLKRSMRPEDFRQFSQKVTQIESDLSKLKDHNISQHNVNSIKHQFGKLTEKIDNKKRHESLVEVDVLSKQVSALYNLYLLRDEINDRISIDGDMFYKFRSGSDDIKKDYLNKLFRFLEGVTDELSSIDSSISSFMRKSSTIFSTVQESQALRDSFLEIAKHYSTQTRALREVLQQHSKHDIIGDTATMQEVTKKLSPIIMYGYVRSSSEQHKVDRILQDLTFTQEES